MSLTPTHNDNDEVIATILGVSPEKINNEDISLIEHFDYVALKMLSGQKIDEILSGGRKELFFKYCGFHTPQPHHPIGRQAIIQFLKKHSVAWKRMAKAGKN